MSRWTCPSCGVGEMQPEKFSNYYMCDFCGNRIYQPSGYSGRLPTTSEIRESIKGPVERSCEELRRSAEDVRRSAQAYTSALNAKKPARKEKKGSFLGKLVGAIVVLWLLSQFLS